MHPIKTIQIGCKRNAHSIYWFIWPTKLSCKSQCLNFPWNTTLKHPLYAWILKWKRHLQADIKLDNSIVHIPNKKNPSASPKNMKVRSGTKEIKIVNDDPGWVQRECKQHISNYLTNRSFMWPYKQDCSLISDRGLGTILWTTSPSSPNKTST